MTQHAPKNTISTSHLICLLIAADDGREQADGANCLRMSEDKTFGEELLARTRVGLFFEPLERLGRLRVACQLLAQPNQHGLRDAVPFRTRSRRLCRPQDEVGRQHSVSGDEKARVSGVRPRLSSHGVMQSAGLHAPLPL
jgi:hypothetical protein